MPASDAGRRSALADVLEVVLDTHQFAHGCIPGQAAPRSVRQGLVLLVLDTHQLPETCIATCFGHRGFLALVALDTHKACFGPPGFVSELWTVARSGQASKCRLPGQAAPQAVHQMMGVPSFSIVLPSFPSHSPISSAASECARVISTSPRTSPIARAHQGARHDLLPRPGASSRHAQAIARRGQHALRAARPCRASTHPKTPRPDSARTRHRDQSDHDRTARSLQGTRTHPAHRLKPLCSRIFAWSTSMQSMAYAVNCGTRWELSIG